MQLPAIKLEPAVESDATLLANLLELYAHDLSDVFSLAIGPEGRYGYPHLPLYFREPGRFAFLIRVDGQLAGFALVTQGSVLDPDVFDVAEFFVLRAWRRSGVGYAAASRLWDQMPGPWMVRAADRNTNAVAFWHRLIADYTRGAFTKEQRVVAGKPWTVFTFSSTA